MRVLEIGCAEPGVLKAFTEKGCLKGSIKIDEPGLVLVGGQQQVMSFKMLGKIPYCHLLPVPVYKWILKLSKHDVYSLAEKKETGISLERFERIVQKTCNAVVNRTLCFINPINTCKFVWLETQTPVGHH